jgi:hypothetical protein
MPEREVLSPVSRRGSKVGSGQPMSPGAKSAPGRSDQAPSHEPEPPLHERTVQQGAEPAAPGETGPAAAARGDSVPSGQSMMDYYLQRSLTAAGFVLCRWLRAGDDAQSDL